MNHLLSVLNSTDPRAILQANMDALDTSAAFARVPSLVSGSPTTDLGAPATGTFVLGDLWTDAACGVWRCTVAGTPGTWVQLEPAMGIAFPVGTIPDGYRAARSDQHGTVYYYDLGTTTWMPVVAAMTAGQVRFDGSGYLWLKCSDNLYRKVLGVMVDGVATLTLGDDTSA